MVITNYQYECYYLQNKQMSYFEFESRYYWRTYLYCVTGYTYRYLYKNIYLGIDSLPTWI